MSDDKRKDEPKSKVPFLPGEIPSEDLRCEHIPVHSSTLDEIWRFALTFDGYARAGSATQCSDAANCALERYRTTCELPSELDVLRMCLFFEQRRWRHLGCQPEGKDLTYVRALIAEIRRAITHSH